MSRRIYKGLPFLMEVFNGAEEAASIVSSSMGPGGGGVFLGNEISKDGAQIAKHLVDCADKNMQRGWSLIREASMKMASTTGDGSTTVVVLLINLMKEVLNLLQAETSSRKIREAINFGSKELIKLVDTFTQPITTAKDIKNIALVASNHDNEMADFVARAFEETNNIGRVIIETSPNNSTSLEVLPGFYIDKGIGSRYFYKTGEENNLQKIDLRNPHILVTDKSIDMSFYTEAVRLEFINKLISDPLLIIADDFSQEMLQFFAVNRSAGRLNVVCVKAPGFGDRKIDVLEDIAVMTGADIIYKDRDNWDKLSSDRWQSTLGQAKLVKISSKDTLIVEGKGQETSTRSRIELIKEKMEQSSSSYDKEKLEERLGNLQGGICILRLGAKTESEMTERKYRGEDTIRACREAKENGIVAGGGIEFLYLRYLFLKKEYKETQKEVSNLAKLIFGKVLNKIFIKILANSGIENWQIIENQIESGFDNGIVDYGYDVIKKMEGRLLELGIINPASISKSSLNIAVSLASLFAELKGGIIEIQKESEDKKDFYQDLRE